MQPPPPQAPNLRKSIVTHSFLLPWRSLVAEVAALARRYPLVVRTEFKYTSLLGTLVTTGNLGSVFAYHRANAEVLPATVCYELTVPSGDSFMRACTPVDLFAPETQRSLMTARNALPASRASGVHLQYAHAMLRHLIATGEATPPPPDLETLPVAQYAGVLAHLFVQRATACAMRVRNATWVAETETLLLGVVCSSARDARVVQLALGPRGLAVQWPAFEYHAQLGVVASDSTAFAATTSMHAMFDDWKHAAAAAAGGNEATVIFPLQGPYAHLAAAEAPLPPLLITIPWQPQPQRAPVTFNYLWGNERATRDEAEREEMRAMHHWECA